ncbi:MAG TPA: DUF1501 domain-containing protein, partial [Magnetospirillum sp.]|nr:DUF1501 domain-containing protein [Magnetospirillum sp.]
EGVQASAMAEEAMSDPADSMTAEPPRKGRDFRTMAQAAGRLLAAPEGPRVAVLELGGWDTHVGQGLATGRMAETLGKLAAGLDALAQALGPAWRNTIVVTLTEFGRTVAANGTNGTDHGTASLSLLLGGKVAGGRVLTDWPGLSPAALHEGRDLKPTTDVRAVLKGVLADHLGASKAALDSAVFPDSGAVAAMRGMVRGV